MTYSIKVENLSKQYQLGELHREATLRDTLVNLAKNPFRKRQRETIWALKDLSFSINEGDVFGIIGRNGAGKSTLLKVLSKITYPTSGSITVNGRIASLLEVGTGFHLELTGRENIYLNGSILGMKKREIDANLDKIIDFSGVEKFIDTPIKRYSSGMRLRLGFAVAAHLLAEVLLIDEVLAVGDAEFQKKCLDSMSDLGSKGKTVLFVSHNMAAVENLCKRVIWIDNGKIRKDGNASEVIKDYMPTFVGQQLTGFDLRSIDHRGGNGVMRFTGMEFLNAERNNQKLIRSGDSLIARLHYHAKEKINNPHVALELYTELGAMITSINTWATGYDIAFLSPGDGYIEFEVDSLNIKSGRYYISLWLASAGNLFYDHVEHFATIDIEPSDFYHSGREMNNQHYGLVLLPVKWKYSPQ